MVDSSLKVQVQEKMHFLPMTEACCYAPCYRHYSCLCTPAWPRWWSAQDDGNKALPWVKKRVPKVPLWTQVLKGESVVFRIHARVFSLPTFLYLLHYIHSSIYNHLSSGLWVQWGRRHWSQYCLSQNPHHHNHLKGNSNKSDSFCQSLHPRVFEKSPLTLLCLVLVFLGQRISSFSELYHKLWTQDEVGALLKAVIKQRPSSSCLQAQTLLIRRNPFIVLDLGICSFSWMENSASRVMVFPVRVYMKIRPLAVPPSDVEWKEETVQSWGCSTKRDMELAGQNAGQNFYKGLLTDD